MIVISPDEEFLKANPVGSFEDQLEELKTVLEENTQRPLILIGYSYGSLLSFVFTGLYPDFVKKLILLSSSVFEDQYAAKIMSTRLKRMGEKERIKAEALLEKCGHHPWLKSQAKERFYKALEREVDLSLSKNPPFLL